MNSNIDTVVCSELTPELLDDYLKECFKSEGKQYKDIVLLVPKGIDYAALDEVIKKRIEHE